MLLCLAVLALLMPSQPFAVSWELGWSDDMDFWHTTQLSSSYIMTHPGNREGSQ